MSLGMKKGFLGSGNWCGTPGCGPMGGCAGSNNRTKKNETSTQAQSTESGKEITGRCTEPGLWLTHLQFSTCIES